MNGLLAGIATRRLFLSASCLWESGLLPIGKASETSLADLHCCLCAAFLPTVLAGPVLGAAIVYDKEVGHWVAAPRRLLGKPPKPAAPVTP